MEDRRWELGDGDGGNIEHRTPNIERRMGKGTEGTNGTNGTEGLEDGR